MFQNFLVAMDDSAIANQDFDQALALAKIRSTLVDCDTLLENFAAK